MAPIVNNTQNDLNTQMKEYPHFTHLETPGLNHEKLLGLMESLEEESDDDDLCKTEIVSKLNFKSWVHAQMEEYEQAEVINKKVISMTEGKNVVSLGNHVFLSWRAGRELEALDYVSKLQEMKEQPDFTECIDVAKAELAYSYSRIGGPRNLFQAINLLEEFVQKYPRKYFWKLRLGVVYRRSSHVNIYVTMSNGLTLIDYIKKANAILTDVIENSNDNKLRGPAYSELAVLCKYATNDITKEDHMRIFHKQSPNNLCEEALKYGNTSTWVLTNCGKVLWPKDAIPILEKCLCLRKHTTTHHQLGNCYYRQAQYETKADQQRRRRPEEAFQATRDIPKSAGTTYVPIHQRHYKYPTCDIPQIKLPNANFDKAEYNFLQAIKLSHDRNLPALFALGLLYQSAALEDKALHSFNKITNIGGREHLFTVIKAYENAGLIYLRKEGHETLAEEKLTKAISLAVTLASTCPDLHQSAPEMWRSFGAMKDRLEKEKHSQTRDKKFIQLYDLVENYGKVVKVIKKLLDMSDSEFNDPGVIIRGLNGYLKLNQPEEALTFLKMLSTRPDIMSSPAWQSEQMINLRCQVFLQAAESRLKAQSQEEAKYLFQDLFKLHYGQCAGDASDDTKDPPNIRDVLFIYDEDHDTEEGLSKISKNVIALPELFQKVFGLNTSRNLQGCLEYGHKMQIQLEEMKKYQLVIVVLGKEDRNKNFDLLLKTIPSMQIRDPPITNVLVINTCDDRRAVPEFLGQYRCYTALDNFGSLVHRDQGAIANRDQKSVENIGNIEGEGVNVLMRLFCFIINQAWPCG